MPARGAVGARAGGGVQRIDADERGAQARGSLDERAQIAEVADSPVARRAQAVELHREAPEPRAELERLGRMAARPLFQDDGLLRGFLRRPERFQQRAAGLRVDLPRLAPDVDVAVGDLALPFSRHQLTLQAALLPRCSGP